MPTSRENGYINTGEKDGRMTGMWLQGVPVTGPNYLQGLSVIGWEQLQGLSATGPVTCRGSQ